MSTLGLLIFITILATGSTTEVVDPQYLYAEQLFESGDYQAARLAYKRLLFYQPDTELRDIADYQIARTYYYQNQTVRAAALFREFSATHPNSPLRFRSQLMLGQLHFDAGKYSLARTTLFELLHTRQDPEVVAAARYLRGWCYIYTTDWNKAISELRQVDTSQTGALRGEKAGWLSTVVPGSGQLYVGKVKEGILAAVLNGVCIYLVADAIRDRRYVDSAGLFFVGWQFYSGNRTDARQFAAGYNKHHEQAFIETLKRQAESVRPQ